MKSISICSIEGCDNRRKYPTGYCGTHQARWQKYGDPLSPLVHKKISRLSGESDAAFNQRRFWSYVDKNGPIHPILGTPCHLWIAGPYRRKGYGQFYVAIDSKLRQVRPHRYIYELTFGPLGELGACHKCDNPRCVNLDHLYAGTQKDNARDRDSRGRGNYRSGSDIVPSLPLEKVAEVEALLADGLTCDEVAVRAGVGRTTAYRIRRGEHWSAKCGRTDSTR